MTGDRAPTNRRALALHIVRIGLFFAIITVIHLQHARLTAEHSTSGVVELTDSDQAQLQRWFPSAVELPAELHDGDATNLENSANQIIGSILRTSPDCDHVVGFSGPTDTLIALDADGVVVGISVLSSGDTVEHVAKVIEDESFIPSIIGQSRVTIASHAVDSVSGATLTAMAILESVTERLTGQRQSLKFPDPPALETVQSVFEEAIDLRLVASNRSLWQVSNSSGRIIGRILRTSPHSDNIVGFQGPSDTLIAFNVDGKVAGVTLNKTFDNEPYVNWVRDNEYFCTLFNGQTLADLSTMNLREAEVEGVSGATMTSMAMAEGIVLAAQGTYEANQDPPMTRWTFLPQWKFRDLGTAAVILCGIVISFSSLKRHKLLRLLFQLLLIIYLGLINGDLVSQAMIVGWTKAGIPWNHAGGLILLSLAAFCIPMTTRRNTYCTHLCPHGAAQQLLRNRLPWKYRVPKPLARLLKLVPGGLLGVCVVIAMTKPSFSLVNLEPFDAWVFGIAGTVTIVIAIVGLAASLFVPMAYCRFGCPTGAMLNYLKRSGRSDRWSNRDWIALGLVMTAFAIYGAS